MAVGYLCNIFNLDEYIPKKIPSKPVDEAYVTNVVFDNNNDDGNDNNNNNNNVYN